MKEFSKGEKAFEIPHEAFYAAQFEDANPFIMIGFYYNNGESTDGEFRIEWDNVGIRLHAYNDSWEALSKMPELIELMAKIDREKLRYTVKEFAEELVKLGYKDMTQRKKK